MPLFRNRGKHPARSVPWVIYTAVTVNKEGVNNEKPGWMVFLWVRRSGMGERSKWTGSTSDDYIQSTLLIPATFPRAREHLTLRINAQKDVKEAGKEGPSGVA